jgi:hypothetical protein
MSAKTGNLKKNVSDTLVAVMIACTVSGGLVLVFNYIVQGAF